MQWYYYLEEGGILNFMYARKRAVHSLWFIVHSLFAWREVANTSDAAQLLNRITGR